MSNKQMTEGGARQSQISEQSDRLDRATTNLNEVVISLEERLGKVLTPASPTPETNKDATTLVDLAEFIRQQTKKVESATSTIRELIGRIEL